MSIFVLAHSALSIAIRGTKRQCDPTTLSPQIRHCIRQPTPKSCSNLFRNSFAWLFSLTLSSFIYILFKTPSESGDPVEVSCRPTVSISASNTARAL